MDKAIRKRIEQQQMLLQAVIRNIEQIETDLRATLGVERQSDDADLVQEEIAVMEEAGNQVQDAIDKLTEAFDL